jgi:hypothetical protein
MTTDVTGLQAVQTSDITVLRCMYDLSPSGADVDEGALVRLLIAEHGMARQGALAAIDAARRRGFLAASDTPLQPA